MNLFQNLYEVRRDGKVITNDMSFEQIYALGPTTRIVEAHWTDGLSQKPVVLKSSFGVVARVVQGGKFLVAMIYTREADCALVVVKSDGKSHLAIADVQEINGEKHRGVFRGFESPHRPADGVFGAVFHASYRATAQYWMDIDATTGAVLECTWTR
jgi:hypothetical protein